MPFFHCAQIFAKNGIVDVFSRIFRFKNRKLLVSLVVLLSRKWIHQNSSFKQWHQTEPMFNFVSISFQQIQTAHSTSWWMVVKWIEIKWKSKFCRYKLWIVFQQMKLGKHQKSLWKLRERKNYNLTGYYRGIAIEIYESINSKTLAADERWRWERRWIETIMIVWQLHKNFRSRARSLTLSCYVID